jgi:hypothetical protein
MSTPRLLAILLFCAAPLATLSQTASFTYQGMNGMVWLALATNATPDAALPDGSICTTTSGQFFVRSNGSWVLH